MPSPVTVVDSSGLFADEEDSTPVQISGCTAPVLPIAAPRTPVRSLYAMSPIGYMGMMLPKSKSVGRVHSGERRALLSDGTLGDVSPVPSALSGAVRSVCGVGCAEVADVSWLARCEEEDEAWASDCDVSQREAASVSALAASLQWQVKNP